MARGAGNGLGHAADGGAHGGENRHLAVGGFMALRAFGVLTALGYRPHLFEF